MQYTRSTSGLILAREDRDAQTIERQLRRLDPQLSLQAWPQADGPPLWRVVRHHSQDQPPETIASWVGADGQPLPLADGIVDLVRRLDRNSRVAFVDADEKNRRFERARDRDWA